jgi:hypothetical protein
VIVFVLGEGVVFVLGEGVVPSEESKISVKILPESTQELEVTGMSGKNENLFIVSLSGETEVGFGADCVGMSSWLVSAVGTGVEDVIAGPG